MKIALAAPLSALLASASVHAATPQLERFVDPAEGAFSVGVPSGFRVNGAMIRYGAMTLAPVVQALAPDGSMLIQLGDPRIKDYAAPRLGFPPGSLYRPGTSITVIRAPESGAQYARAYALDLAARVHCRDATADPVEVPNLPGSASGPGRTTSGLATFGCESPRGHLVGKVFATTRIVPAPGGAMWGVVLLGSFVAQADRAQEAERLWLAMSRSYAVDPAWNRREGEIATGSARVVARQWDGQLDLARRFDQQAIRGEVTVADPVLGTRRDAPIGTGPYYHADGLGRTTDSPSPTPGLGQHPVTPLW